MVVILLVKKTCIIILFTLHFNDIVNTSYASDYRGEEFQAKSSHRFEYINICYLFKIHEKPVFFFQLTLYIHCVVPP